MDNERERRVTRRLFLGEGDFNYTVAHTQKHPEGIPSLVATEHQPLEELMTRATFVKNYEKLCELGVQTCFGVDARNLVGSKVPMQRYARIQFNFPYIREDYKVSTANRDLIDGVFRSAKVLQIKGDEVHITLPKKKEAFRYCFIHGLGDAAWKHGYQLKSKRRFDTERYPEYQHNQTGNSSIVVTEGREWVFRKVADTEYEIKAMHEAFPPKRRKITIERFKEARSYIVDPMSTASESSSEEGIDEDAVLIVLKQKALVADETQRLVSDGYSEELSRLLLEASKVGGYWDIDGGIEAMSYLGNCFQGSHAKYIANRVKLDPSWRAQSAMKAIEQLSKSVSLQRVIQNIVTVLASLEEVDAEGSLASIAVMKEYIASKDLDAAAIYWLDSALKWWQYRGDKISLIDANRYATFPPSLHSQISLVKHLISSDAVLEGYITKHGHHDQYCIRTLVQEGYLPSGYGVRKWFMGLSAQTKKTLALSALSSKEQVYAMTDMIQSYQLLSPKQLANALIIVSGQVQDSYWDIGPKYNKGGIEAMGLLGNAFDDRHAQYIADRVALDESWRASSAITAITSLMQSDVNLLLIPFIQGIKQAFRIPEYVKQLSEISIIPQSAQLFRPQSCQPVDMDVEIASEPSAMVI